MSRSATKLFYIFIRTPQGVFYIRVQADVQQDAAFYAHHHWPNHSIERIMSSGQFWHYRARTKKTVQELPKDYV